jgi:serine/threonine-protein kinase HipA
MEIDHLLGVSDLPRLGALSFHNARDQDFEPRQQRVFLAHSTWRLLQVTERILRDEETDEDLQMIFAPGSSLGKATPESFVIDRHGNF